MCRLCSRWAGVALLLAAAQFGLLAVGVSWYLSCHGSFFVSNPGWSAWPGSFPRLRLLDLLERPKCFQQLLMPPGDPRRDLSEAACPEVHASGSASWLDLRTPFLIQGGFKRWNIRWDKALKLMGEYFGTQPLLLHQAPVEQTEQKLQETTWSAFASELRKWPANVTPQRPLYASEVELAGWEKHKITGKPRIWCDRLPDFNKCTKLIQFLFQDFGWAGPLFGESIHEVESSMWAGPAGSRTGLHADIDPFNLLVVTQGRKQVTLWPPQLRSHLSPHGRFDESASVSEVDVFDPEVSKKFPDFAAVRNHNFSVLLSAGDVLHIPAGWWHVAENKETTVAVTFHIWRWDWREKLYWLPHQLLTWLHDKGLYRTGHCTCHRPSEPAKAPLYNRMDGDDGAQSVCTANTPDCQVAGTKESAPKKSSPPLDEEWTMLDAVKSQYQSVAVWYNVAEKNRFLLLDGDVQFTSKHEFVYHEMMAFVPLAVVNCNSTEPKPHLRVFVFGAGDAGVVKRLLQHRAVKHVLHVEIDEAVVNVSRQFFPELQPAAEEHGSRYRMWIGDGVAFAHKVARSAEAGTFDVVLLDTTDVLVAETEEERAAGRELFTASLYSDLAAMLRPGGILVQNVQSYDQEKDVRALYSRVKDIFADVAPYQFATPDYGSPYFVFLASNKLVCARRAECGTKFLKNDLTGPAPQFYNSKVHQAAFTLPASLEDIEHPGVACSSYEGATAV